MTDEERAILNMQDEIKRLQTKIRAALPAAKVQWAAEEVERKAKRAAERASAKAVCDEKQIAAREKRLAERAPGPMKTKEELDAAMRAARVARIAKTDAAQDARVARIAKHSDTWGSSHLEVEAARKRAKAAKDNAWTEEHAASVLKAGNKMWNAAAKLSNEEQELMIARTTPNHLRTVTLSAALKAHERALVRQISIMKAATKAAKKDTTIARVDANNTLAARAIATKPKKLVTSLDVDCAVSEAERTQAIYTAAPTPANAALARSAETIALSKIKSFNVLKNPGVRTTADEWIAARKTKPDLLK